MKPIIFSTEMVQKILSGDKSQTRRVVKIPSWTWDKADDLKLENGNLFANSRKTKEQSPINPPYAVGDVLWVRETHCPLVVLDGVQQYAYRADGEVGEQEHLDKHDKWRPAIHMPREGARIFLRVKDIRAERLCEIVNSESDAKAEGVMGLENYPGEPWAISNFIRLWNCLNADRGHGWDKNPWVWVVEFERCEKP